MIRSFISRSFSLSLAAERGLQRQGAAAARRTIATGNVNDSKKDLHGMGMLRKADFSESSHAMAYEREEQHFDVEETAEEMSKKNEGEVASQTTQGDMDASVSDHKSLDEFEMSETLRANLMRGGITSLFPVQSQSYEAVVSGRDMIAKSPTGSGKTLAFAIPIVQKLITSDAPRRKEPRALIVSPTRELAVQIEREIKRIAPQLRIAAMYGGVSYNQQLGSIRRGLDIVVGTPGRLIDLMSREGPGGLRLESIDTLVLDEADEMLKMGFQDDVDEIMGVIPDDRQLLLWSATVPQWVRRLMKTHMENPVSVDLVGEGVRIPSQVKNYAFASLPEHRAPIAQRLLSAYAPGGRALIFTNTKSSANELSHSGGFPNAAPLHGDLSQQARESVLRKFHSGDIKCLMATDVAARGLDIKGVELVIHYELPDKAESFVHRSGRTGRAGKGGTNVVMYSPGEERELQRLMKEVEVEPSMPELPITTSVAVAAAKEGRKAIKKGMKTALTIPDAFKEQAAKLVRGVVSPSAVEANDADEDIAHDTMPSLVPGEDVERLLAVALMEATGFSTSSYSRLTGRKNVRTLLMRTDRPFPSRGKAYDELTAFGIETRHIIGVASCKDGVLFDTTPMKSEELLGESVPTVVVSTSSDSPVDMPLFSVPESLPPFRTDDGRRGRGGYGGYRRDGRGGGYNDRRRDGRGGGYRGGGGRGRRGGGGGGGGRGRYHESDRNDNHNGGGGGRYGGRYERRGGGNDYGRDRDYNGGDRRRGRGGGGGRGGGRGRGGGGRRGGGGGRGGGRGGEYSQETFHFDF